VGGPVGNLIDHLLLSKCLEVGIERYLAIQVLIQVIETVLPRKIVRMEGYLEVVVKGVVLAKRINILQERPNPR
jgi:hypothetical protein